MPGGVIANDFLMTFVLPGGMGPRVKTKCYAQ